MFSDAACVKLQKYSYLYVIEFTVGLLGITVGSSTDRIDQNQIVQNMWTDLEKRQILHSSKLK